MRSITFIYALMSILCVCRNSHGEEIKAPTGVSFLDEAPDIRIMEYSPEKLIKVSNALIKLGKIEGPKTLREYVKYKLAKDQSYDDSAVYLICKMIFKPKKTEAFPPLGAGSSFLTSEGEASFANFPLLIANGIPFLLINGYQLQGDRFGSLLYLDACEKTMDYNAELYVYSDVKTASIVALRMVSENKLLSEKEKIIISDIILYQTQRSLAPEVNSTGKP